MQVWPTCWIPQKADHAAYPGLYKPQIPIPNDPVSDILKCKSLHYVFIKHRSLRQLEKLYVSCQSVQLRTTETSTSSTISQTTYHIPVYSSIFGHYSLANKQVSWCINLAIIWTLKLSGLSLLSAVLYNPSSRNSLIIFWWLISYEKPTFSPEFSQSFPIFEESCSTLQTHPFYLQHMLFIFLSSFLLFYISLRRHWQSKSLLICLECQGIGWGRIQKQSMVSFQEPPYSSWIH